MQTHTYIHISITHVCVCVHTPDDTFIHNSLFFHHKHPIHRHKLFCSHMYINTYTHMHSYVRCIIHTYTQYMIIHVHTSRWFLKAVYTHTYVFLYIYIYTYMCIHAYLHALYIRALYNIHVQTIYEYACTHLPMILKISLQTYIHSFYTNIYTYICVHAYLHKLYNKTIQTLHNIYVHAICE